MANLERRLEGGLPDVETWRRRVDDLARTAHTSLANRLELVRTRVDSAAYRLRALNPIATLRRGFAVVQRAGGGQVINSATQVIDGDPLTITLVDGVVPATVGNGAKPKVGRHKDKAARQPSLMERLI